MFVNIIIDRSIDTTSIQSDVADVVRTKIVLDNYTVRSTVTSATLGVKGIGAYFLPLKVNTVPHGA